MNLTLTIILAACAVFVTLLTSWVLAYHNLESRNLVLSTATLTGALVFFVLQMPLELKRSPIQDYTNVEFTIIRTVPEIRQWEYRLPATDRSTAELQASNWLAKNNPAAFGEDREKLTRDFALFSLVSMLALKEPDWQTERLFYQSRFHGPTILRQGLLSRPDECTAFTENDLRDRLATAHNLFVGAPIRPRPPRICFPPNSVLTISDSVLIIRNQFCEVSFTIDGPYTTLFAKPGTVETPQLPGGSGPIFEHRLMGIRVTGSYFALRAHHRDMVKYKAWVSRLLIDLHEWFEGM